MFSAEELEQVKALAAELSVEQAGLAAKSSERLFRQSRLLRFIQSNVGSVDAAAAQFREMLTWREEAGIEELRPPIEGKPWAAASVPGLERFFQLTAADMFGRTREGDMLLVQCDGQAKLGDIESLTDDELYVVLHSMMELRQDHLDRLSEEQEKLTKVVQVRDLSGLALSYIIVNAGLIRRLQNIMKTSLSAYPESVRKVILLEPPTGFETLFSLLTPFMSAHVQAKINMFGIDRFPEIGALVGTSGLEVLTRLHVSPNTDLDFVEVSAGSSAYGFARVVAGTAAEWSFEAGPDEMDIGFSAVLISDDGATEPKEILQFERVMGTVSGKFMAESDGFVWATWSNAYSWFHGKRIEAIRGLKLW